VGADASANNIQMAKLHSRKDPSLWTGPGKLDYRNSTAGKKKKMTGTIDTQLKKKSTSLSCL
jgi:2-polyprenyl-6-hydroxyphenyl methylase/3-demethylubiquinone-9 3-methyltransferase